MRRAGGGLARAAAAVSPAGAALAVVTGCALALPVAAVSQQAVPARIVVAVDPDSVRVGEPFTVGVTVRRADPGDVVFPAVLPLADDLEQQGPVEVRATEDGREWRAYYRIVGWRADRLVISPFEIETATGEGSFTRARVAPPPVTVLSVLPGEEADLPLRDARPFLKLTGFPWWILLLALALAAAAWWWWRRRRARAGTGLSLLGPGERALRELARLREAWGSGALPGVELYDGVEDALRSYVQATRSWPPSDSLIGLANGDESLALALRRSVLVRFARVQITDDGPPGAIQAAESFVRGELTAASPEGPE